MHPLQKALEFVRQEGNVEFNIRSYSGRAMYGKSCLAITGDNMSLILLGMEIARYNIEAEENDINDVVDEADVDSYRQDSMGLGSVIYWPRIPFSGEEKEDEEDED